MQLSDLSIASYKGIQFPCNVTETEVGAALIIHEFGNSDEESIERQGKNPRVYTLTAILTGPGYVTTRERLLRAIEDATPGVLIHPFYGRIENAVPMPVKFTETVKRLGSTDIPITFRIDESSGAPKKSSISPRRITSAKEAVNTALAASFGKSFEVNSGYQGNVSAATEKLGDLIDTIEQVTAIASLPTEYVAKVKSFRRNIGELISSPVELGNAIVDVVDGISNAYETAEQTMTVIGKLLDYGDTDNEILQTTVALTQRSGNNTAINDAVRIASLGVAYETASLLTYRTVDDVSVTERDLERRYSAVRSSADQSTQNAVNQLRVDTRVYLSEQKVSAARIVEMRVSSRPASLLAFDLYGDSSLAEDIIDINQDINVSYLDGNIKVLTE